MNPCKFTVILILAFTANLVIGQAPINTNDDFCYAKLKTPDTYDEVTEEVLVRPASTEISKTPAVYQTVTEQLLITPESTRSIYVPAVYETVEERVVDVPESKKIFSVPAVLESQTESVLVKEESKKLVVVPAVYETVTEQILIKPETKQFIFVPAEFNTISEQVEAKAATKRFVNVPAVYETVTEQIEIEAASTRVETLEPKFKTVQEEVLVKPGYTKWEASKGDQNCLSADPNDCQVWCLVEVPAEYKFVSKTINIGCDGSGIANSGCTKEVAVPAKYANKTKKVIVTPATTREEIIPAEYSTVSRSVMKTPSQVREVVTPAVYETITKQVVKTPATTKEVIIPAEYKTVTKQVVVTPATTREEIIPATYKMVSKRVIKTPATTRVETIPAVYETVSKRVMTAPAQISNREIPAEYKTITKKVIREKGDMQWRRIVCPRHQTADLYAQMQNALRAAGFNPGPSDNVFGPKTYAAMVDFQKSKNMWQGHLDYATAAALGLTLKPEAFQTEDGGALAMGGPDANTIGGNLMSSRGDGAAASNSGSSNSSSGSSNSASSSASNSSNDSSNSNDDNSDASTTMSSQENDMIAEINLMRSNPNGYAKYVEDYITQVQNDDMLDAAYKAEEISSARELINELKSMGPLSILKPHEGLHQVGVKHGEDVQGQGMIGHRGSDGTMPWDRVRRDTELKDGNENLVAGGGSVRESLMILLVDSGIPGRGHRKTLFEPKWTHVGISAIGEVGGIPNAWIQVFGQE